MNRIMTAILLLSITALLFGNVRRDVSLLTSKSKSQSRNNDDINITNGTNYMDATLAKNLFNSFLADSIIPDGVQITKIKVNGYDDKCAFGFYSNMPALGGVKMEDGILITTGDAEMAAGPNEYEDVSKGKFDSTLTDKELEKLVEGDSYDAHSLEIQFTCDSTIKGLSFDFCFGSDEFPEFVNSEYNDVIAVFLDGQNIIADKKGNLISINNAFFDVDNINGSVNLEYDGFTSPLHTSDTLTPGKHTIRFAIADIEDETYDSGIFLSNFRFSYTGKGTSKIEIEDQSFVIDDTTSGGSIVGELVVANSNDENLSFALVSQFPKPHFILDNKTIKVANGVDFDYFTDSLYTLRICVSKIIDGIDVNVFVNVTIQLNHIKQDINLIDDQTFYVDENIPLLTNVGEVLLVDNTIPGLTFSIGSISPHEHFELDGNMIRTSNEIDYEKDSIYSITVIVQGADLLHDIATITVKVRNMDEFQNLIDDQTFYIESNEKPGTKVGDIHLLKSGIGVNIAEQLPKTHFKLLDTEIILDANLDYEKDSLYTLTVYAFCNGYLADTATITVKVQKVSEFMDINSAILFDRNGDGIGDSVSVIVSEKFEDVIPEEVEVIFPENGLKSTFKFDGFDFLGKDSFHTAFKSSSESISTSGIGSLGLHFVTPEDVTVSGKLLDGIGPILIDSAVVKERFTEGEDTITLFLSEEINEEILGESFRLIHFEEEITISINSVVEKNGTTIILTTDMSGDVFEKGDSLRINSDGDICDVLGNKAHQYNTPVPVVIEKRPIPIKEGAYFDCDADGIIDSISIELLYPIAYEVTLFATLQTKKTSSESFTLKADDGKYFSLVSEKIAENIWEGSTNGDVELRISYEGISGSESILLQDKAAPVITSANYLPGPFIDENPPFFQDTLIVEFSEPVDSISSYKPFNLKTENGKQYSIFVTQTKEGKESTHFNVYGDINSQLPKAGDSIQIAISNRVTDILDNNQNNRMNRFVKIKVSDRPFNLFPTVVGPVNPKVYKIPEEIWSAGFSIRNGIMIILDPTYPISSETIDAIECNFSIYDNVGNLIIHMENGFGQEDLIEMYSFESSIGRTMKVIVWSGKNSYHRYVSSGIYLGILKFTTPNGEIKMHRIFIPIKE